ncbi:hypothetical protein CARUB_v10002869mg [Capsella rubella]|uniref:Uncharacterized protein n=1 Tax=Capsella rubella TaxID=81985 RepID=R0HEQ8_9BRAS|nr:hypothetical protein CARUB_v10002869mg [Capsella rubella]
MIIFNGAKRSMLVAIFIAFVVISTMNVADAKVIGYPVIRGGDRPRCDHGKCPPDQPVSPYRPGCEKITRCRRPPPTPIKT